jgi:tRNA (guanine-N7-)-methyltransferase
MNDSLDRHGKLARSSEEVRRRSPEARPDVRRNEDGVVLREVLSYARRGSRFTAKQADAWDRLGEAWVFGPDQVEAIAESERPIDVGARWFDREAPLYVEIGSGVGETTASYAAAHPEVNVLAFEVWLPGVADTLHRADTAGLTNVRLCTVDAAWSLAHLIPEASITELWTLFPDPWHKKRHHKRRLVNQPFVSVASSRLVAGGHWRLATDWADYAEHIDEVLAAEATLSGGRTDRWSDRPLTKFERRGVAEGREIADFDYVRV